MIEEKAPGIYLHIPFCASKCLYCNFYSVKADDAAMDAYTQKLCETIARAAQRWPRQADSLYFGGGTPILLGEKRISRIIAAAKASFGLKNAEITLEANPAHTLADTLQSLSALGINRLSLGLQSAQPQELALLGRTHTVEDAALAVRHAKEAGFQNISLDLMLGIPQQTAQSVENSVQFCADAGVTHISAYLLKIEPGTPFATRHTETLCPDEDGQADLYLAAVESLSRHGFDQYEISNFAKPGFHSRHNCKYWLGAEYLGLGPAAHSFLQGRRLSFPPDLPAFLQSGDPLTLLQDEGAGGNAEEWIMLGLRLCQGIDPGEGQKKFPGYGWEAFWEKTKTMLAAGYMAQKNGHISFTPQGFLLSNSILARIL